MEPSQSKRPRLTESMELEDSSGESTVEMEREEQQSTSRGSRSSSRASRSTSRASRSTSRAQPSTSRAQPSTSQAKPSTSQSPAEMAATSDKSSTEIFKAPAKYNVIENGVERGLLLSENLHSVANIFNTWKEPKRSKYLRWVEHMFFTIGPDVSQEQADHINKMALDIVIQHSDAIERKVQLGKVAEEIDVDQEVAGYMNPEANAADGIYKIDGTVSFPPSMRPLANILNDLPEPIRTNELVWLKGKCYAIDLNYSYSAENEKILTIRGEMSSRVESQMNDIEREREEIRDRERVRQQMNVRGRLPKRGSRRGP